MPVGPGVRVRRRAIAAALILGLSLLAIACSSSGQSTSGPQGGPSPQYLSASTGKGGSAISAPKNHSGGYNATFGSFILCQTHPGMVPVITGIKVHAGNFPHSKSIH